MNPIGAWYSALDFLQGTFFEVMVCLSVGMEIFTYKEYLNLSDYFAIGNQMFVLAVMTFFIGVIIYFSCSIVPKL